jgi:hypothetical protein
MTRWQYWAQCVKRTWRSAWGITGIISTLLTLLGAVGSLWKDFGEVMNILVWLLPLLGLVVGSTRLFVRCRWRSGAWIALGGQPAARALVGGHCHRHHLSRT